MNRRKLAIPHRAFNVLAGAGTVHDGMFLLLRRSARESFLPNAWGIPAGRVEFGEDVAKASLRELSEETGLHGEEATLIGYSSFSSNRDSVQLANVQLNFLVITRDAKVRLDQANHSEHRWIQIDDTGNPLLDDFTRLILTKARVCYEERTAMKLF